MWQILYPNIWPHFHFLSSECVHAVNPKADKATFCYIMLRNRNVPSFLLKCNMCEAFSVTWMTNDTLCDVTTRNITTNVQHPPTMLCVLGDACHFVANQTVKGNTCTAGIALALVSSSVVSFINLIFRNVARRRKTASLRQHTACTCIQTVWDALSRRVQQLPLTDSLAFLPVSKTT